MVGYSRECAAQTFRNTNGLATLGAVLLAIMSKPNIASAIRQAQLEHVDCLPPLATRTDQSPVSVRATLRVYSQAVMLHEDALNIYTDGSMFSSPRAGGIGIVFVIINDAGDAQVVKEFDRPGYKQSTNQEMELEACIVALEEALDEDDFARYVKIEIFTDSRYVSEGCTRAMFVWCKTQWKSPETGRPILHVDQWKRLLRLLKRAQQARRRVNIRWVKGHKGNPYNKAADKAAKRSAKNPLNKPLSTVSVRRKKSAKKTEIGSVKMLGQQLIVRIITAQFLGSPHRLWKYKYEVSSRDSEYCGNVDEVFSEIYMRDGHDYEVRFNDSTENPRIVELIREIVPDSISET
jgi:ribonuclease HI